MKTFLKILCGLVLALIIMIAAILSFLAYKSPGKTPAILGPAGNPLAGSIAAYEQIELGGYKQWILMRGDHVTAPVLLILHGGPGSPEMPMVRQYLPELEKHFVVVNWDQLGAGKSYSDKIPKQALTIGNYIEDANQLVQYLKKRFNKKKIYIEGHSWGSALGALLIQKIPVDVKAYVGIGQVTNMVENEKLGYEAVLAEAGKRKDEKALEELKALGPPPYKELKQTGVERKWVAMYGGTVKKDALGLIGKALVNNEEYTFEDKYIKYAKGSMFSLSSVWDELIKGDLFRDAKTWKVPVYIIAGRHDMTIIPSQTEKYFKFIKAPKKEFFWFENSAHMCSYEEPEKYMDIMVNKVLKENE